MTKPKRAGHPAGEGLERSTLRAVRGGLELVRRAEAELSNPVHGVEMQERLKETHLHLRAGVLGLMVAYSQLAGLPDPRETYPGQQ